MATPENNQWHHMSTEEIVRQWASDKDTGLDPSEADARLEKYGANTLSTTGRQSRLVRFLLQFHQPLIYILIGSGFITALLQEWVDSAVIFGVVLANALVGYIQESKAVNALAALAKTMSSQATVLRQGKKLQLNSSRVVPGDIVLLESGDKVAGDLRIIEKKGLQIDESALTGESLPVDKSTAVIDADTSLADRTNLAYATTLVTKGQAKGIVVGTGDWTEMGRISRLMSSTRELETPLTRKITAFSKLLMYAILGLTCATVIVGLVRGQSLFDMFMAAVALAVGAIPEGLPAAVTITLAIGVGRMAKQRAIIRKLPAVETLGSTTIICSDKTGTLTENRMTVQHIFAGKTLFSVSGTGYDPAAGQIMLDGETVETGDHPALKACVAAGMLCNDSTLIQKNEGWQVQGDPTEGAMLVAAGKAGLPESANELGFTRLSSIPFESEHQFMAVLYATDQDAPPKMFVKGGLETILGSCSDRMDDDGGHATLEPETIQQQAAELASQGLRVLALAEKTLPAATRKIEHGDAQEGLTFIGLQGMMDPPRKEAAKAVRACLDAGVQVKMITGDHALTAAAIAYKIGLLDSPSVGADSPLVTTGQELEQISDEELPDIAAKTVVFSRTSPEQKLRLVNALQSRGNIVAMTGDGVNDAPALKQADIGVAMGVNGTEVAKEASDMVLTDDNFQSIEAAVEEGRGVFDNLTKFIVWTLPTNLGEGLVIVAAIFFGVTLPIVPVQILWINMTTAGFLGLMLAFEPKEPGIMQRPPRNPQKPILTAPVIEQIILVGILLLISTFILFKIELSRGSSLEQARTVAVNTFIMIELFYLFNCRSMTRSFFRLGFFTNPWVFGGISIMLLIQLFYTYMPVMNKLFQSSPISIVSWTYIVLTGCITFLIIEGEKAVHRRMGKQ